MKYASAVTAGHEPKVETKGRGAQINLHICVHARPELPLTILMKIQIRPMKGSRFSHLTRRSLYLVRRRSKEVCLIAFAIAAAAAVAKHTGSDLAETLKEHQPPTTGHLFSGGRDQIDARFS